MFSVCGLGIDNNPKLVVRNIDYMCFRSAGSEMMHSPLWTFTISGFPLAYFDH